MSTLSFRRFTNAYALREVDPAALIELLRPHAAHLAANGAMLPTDPDRLDIERVEVALLTTSVGELPIDLLDALWHIHEMSTSLYKTVSEGWRTTLGVARWVCD